MPQIYQQTSGVIVDVAGQGGAITIRGDKHVSAVVRMPGYAIGVFRLTLDSLAAVNARECHIDVAVYDALPIEVGAFPAPVFEPIIAHFSNTVKIIFFQTLIVADIDDVSLEPWDPLSFSVEIKRLPNAV